MSFRARPLAESRNPFSMRSQMLVKGSLHASALGGLGRDDKPVGLPIGNVTSQIFANIYLNELDQFIKHKLKVKHYFRYADDFVLFNSDQNLLYRQLEEISMFLTNELLLILHPDKVSIRKYNQGIDFLGYVILPHHIVLLTKTKKRMFKKIDEKRLLWQAGEITEESFDQSLQSYLGLLKHGNCFGLKQRILSN